tara:strand:+ start:2044 stop:2268 length:225 start_codon:yes stop_codon:yes gene_type:complete
MVFRHPNYYKELRKRNKSDRAISKEQPDGVHTSVRPGPGPEAASDKQQAPESPSDKQQASSTKPFEMVDTIIKP